MKATIKKVTEPNGDTSFMVYEDDAFRRVFMFKPDYADNEFYSEKQALDRAMKLAKRIETGLPLNEEEIIYQTEDKMIVDSEGQLGGGC